MSQAALHITFKILQLLVCIGALIYKKLTDNKARMILIRNQKLSNEWNLLQNVTWSQEGSDFSIFTYAGYTFILSVCLLARLMDLHKRPSTTDTLLMRFGLLIFLFQGILVFYSVEYVPEEIQLNAFILGSLSFVVVILLFLEDCLTDKAHERAHIFTQTEKPIKKIISSLPVQKKDNEDDDNNILHTYV